MEDEQFESLKEGDVIRHKMGSEGYMVCANYGKSGVVVTRTRLISSPREWDLILKASHEKADG